MFIKPLALELKLLARGLRGGVLTGVRGKATSATGECTSSVCPKSAGLDGASTGYISHVGLTGAATVSSTAVPTTGDVPISWGVPGLT